MKRRAFINRTENDCFLFFENAYPVTNLFLGNAFHKCKNNDSNRIQKPAFFFISKINFS